MRYDFDSGERGVSECPKCKFSMERLRNSSLLDRRSGYLLDTGGWDRDDHIVTSYLFGSLLRFLWRQVLEPVSYKLFGDWQNRRYRKILRDYPQSLVCTHCHHVIRRK